MRPSGSNQVNSTCTGSPGGSVRAARASLLKELENRYAAPETLIEDVLIRYSEGKDLVSDYKAAVQRVSVAGVQEVLRLFSGGGEVEYTIY